MNSSAAASTRIGLAALRHTSPVAKRATVLKVTGLRRAFGPNTIFDKFNLEVRAGEADRKSVV